ncbi:MAG TPA: glycosyltransferase [Acidimicrobiales bacterium]|nr:glycosyltransferase [Acidimicrobiales bacterium]
MRVLQVSTWDTACGIADYTSSLRTALEASGVECEVWAIDRTETKYLSRAELTEYFSDLAQTAATGYDVVHVQHEFSFFAGEYGVRTSVDNLALVLQRLQRAHVPTVITCHTHPAAALPRRLRRLHRAMLMYFRARLRVPVARGNVQVIAHNRLTRRALLDFGLAPNRVHVIPIGVKTSEPPSDVQRAEAKRSLGFSALSTVLGMFGFVVPHKGHVAALEALALLPETYCLVIVGSAHPHGTSSAVNDILRWLDEHPAVAPRVRLAGWVERDEMQRYVDAVDVHLAPYQTEPVLSASAAVAAAVGSGRPVVASNIPAFEELNTEADCLWLTTPDAPHELQWRIEQLLKSDERRKSLLANGETYAAENSWAVTAGKHKALYESLLAR